MIETPTRPITTPQEEVTPIGPSEALKLGRLIRPKHRAGCLFWGDDYACALGAMALGWGYSVEPHGDVDDFLYNRMREHVGDGADDVIEDIAGVFDTARADKIDGDEAVLSYLAGRDLL